MIHTIEPSDAVGFTFFISNMAMMAASIFFFFERGRVKDEWKASLLVSGLITLVAAAHYYYMRGIWAEDAVSPTAIRYIDWIITVPLMCAEFYLILKPAGATLELMGKLMVAALWMLIAGYIGEGFAAQQADPGAWSVTWGFISTLGWAYIVYEIFFGDAKKLRDKTESEKVKTGYNLLCGFVFIGWAIYPIGYMLMPGNLLSGLSGVIPIDVVYNLGDAINKIGFGLVVYYIAISETAKSKV